MEIALLRFRTIFLGKKEPLSVTIISGPGIHQELTGVGWRGYIYNLLWFASAKQSTECKSLLRIYLVPIVQSWV